MKLMSPKSETGPVADAEPKGFVRTLLGDLPTDGSLGVCDAHEHVIMHGDWLDGHFSEFVLADLDQTLQDMCGFRAAGGGWIVDSMPTGAGRDAALLAQAAAMEPDSDRLPDRCPSGEVLSAGPSTRLFGLHAAGRAVRARDHDRNRRRRWECLIFVPESLRWPATASG